jgi:glycosyltransferase involved in cell wall biosynthesis
MIWNFLVPHIQEMQKMGFSIDCACSVTGNFFEDLEKKYSYHMHEIAFERSPYSPKNINAYVKLKKLVQNNGYNTIFCHEPIGGVMGRLVGHKYGCKVIYMAHGFHFYYGAPKMNWILYYTAEKLLSHFTDVLVTINKEDYEASLKFKAKKSIKINGIGFNTSIFRCDCDPAYIRKELNLANDDVILLSVGELIKRKNHMSIFEAMKVIDNSKIHYVIAGDGVLKQSLQKRINDLGLTNQIHLLGYRHDISKLCNSADLFVLPSVQEGLSVALMEAMACAKPIIASRIRGNIDLIDPGVGGFLVDTFDVPGYVSAIQQIINSHDNAQKMGAYNTKKVKEYDLEYVKEQMKEIYKEF